MIHIFKKNYDKLKSILGLGFQFAKANFKLRNEGSLLGVFWYLLEPLLLFLIIFLLRNFFNNQNIQEYPIYLLIGLIMYNFFSGTTTISTKLIESNSDMIKSVKINHESLVFSRVLEGSFSHFFEIVILILFMFYLKLSLVWILFYPVIFIFYFLFTLGVSFILSTIGVFINDLDNVWRVLTRFLFFLTPIFYMAEKGEFLYKINMFNPLFYYLTLARDILIYHTFKDYTLLGLGIFFSFFTFLVGFFIFSKYKNKFAEYV